MTFSERRTAVALALNTLAIIGGAAVFVLGYGTLGAYVRLGISPFWFIASASLISVWVCGIAAIRARRSVSPSGDWGDSTASAEERRVGWWLVGMFVSLAATVGSALLIS